MSRRTSERAFEQAIVASLLGEGLYAAQIMPFSDAELETFYAYSRQCMRA